MNYETVRVPINWDDDHDREETLRVMAKERWEPFGADTENVYLQRERRREMGGWERFFRSALFPLLVIAVLVYVASLLFARDADAALNPPVKYVGGAPCRTAKIFGNGFFKKDGEFYKVTHITWCGKHVTVRIKAVTP